MAYQIFQGMVIISYRLHIQSSLMEQLFSSLIYNPDRDILGKLRSKLCSAISDSQNAEPALFQPYC